MHLRLMGYLLLVGVRESGRRCMVLARAGTAPAGSTDAVAALRERVDGEVRFDEGSRAAYSTDASNFRQVPIGVVLPRTIEAAIEAVAVCREHGPPVVNRGGGPHPAREGPKEALLPPFSKNSPPPDSLDRGRRPGPVEARSVV